MDSRPPLRRHDLDALRAFAMLLGLALHAALSFMEVPWVVQDRNQHEAFAVFVAAVHGFRMPVFFLLSGFFTAMLWRRRQMRGLVAQRARRILLPLILACVTILPLNWAIVIWAGSGNATYGARAGRTDIWAAANRGDIPTVSDHVRKGADLDEPGPGRRAEIPVACAVIGGRPEMVAYLLEAGASPDARSRDGNTPLHTAAFFGRDVCAGHLVEAGADVHARNDNGKSPVDVLAHDRRTTLLIARLLQVDIDFDSVAAGRGRIAALLRARGALPTAGQPSGDVDPGDAQAGGGESGRILGKIVEGLMLFPFFHHLWFLWFLCWLVLGFVLAVGVVRLLRLPAPPAWLIRSPVCWLWIVPLSLVPQSVMHMGGAMPGFGPDTSAGLLPMPHLLGYYAILFFFGVLYHGARDDEGRLGRNWWLMLPAALLVVLPLGLGFSFRLPWATDLVGDEGTRRFLANVLQVLYPWMMTFGLMGLCRRVLSRDRPWVRYLSDSSYWLYLAHLPLIIAMQAMVRDWPLPSPVKFTGVLVIATAALLVSYRVAVRYTWLGRLLNGRRTRPGTLGT